MQKRYQGRTNNIVFASNYSMQIRCKYDANIRCKNDACAGQIISFLHRICKYSMQKRCLCRTNFDANTLQIRCKYSMQKRCLCRTNCDANTMLSSDKFRCKDDANIRCKCDAKIDAMTGHVTMQIRCYRRTNFDSNTMQINNPKYRYCIEYGQANTMQNRFKSGTSNYDANTVLSRCIFSRVPLRLNYPSIASNYDAKTMQNRRTCSRDILTA
jgi:hypothetical protein